MPIHLVRISSSICEDSYEEGEGASTGCGLSDERIGKDFKSKKEMLKWLEQNYGLSSNPDHYEFDEVRGVAETDKLVADHSNEQNGGWFEPTKEEKEQWKRGRKKLYNEHTWIHFHKWSGYREE